MFPENIAHFHLMVTHLPVFGFLLGTLALIVARVWNSRDAARLSMLIIVFSALTAIPVYVTGEPAEDIVEGLPSVEHRFIEEHEDAALWALILMELAGVLALAGLFTSRGHGHPHNGLLIATIVISLVAFGAVARTAKLGGKIHHPEARGAFAGGGGHSEVEDEDE